MSAQKSTSPSACSIGLPISRTMISASSSRRSLWKSATFLTSAARSATEDSSPQFLWASSAAAIAASRLLVGDVRVLLDRFSGCWVYDCVFAHRAPLLVRSRGVFGPTPQAISGEISSPARSSAPRERGDAPRSRAQAVDSRARTSSIGSSPCSMNSSSSGLTSSECVHPMLCGPSATHDGEVGDQRPRRGRPWPRRAGCGPRCRARPAWARRSWAGRRGSRSSQASTQA